MTDNRKDATGAFNATAAAGQTAYLVYSPENAKKYGICHAEVKNRHGKTVTVAYTDLLHTQPQKKDWPHAQMTKVGRDESFTVLPADPAARDVSWLVYSATDAKKSGSAFADVIDADGKTHTVEYTEMLHRPPTQADLSGGRVVWAGQTANCARPDDVYLVYSPETERALGASYARVKNADGTEGLVPYTDMLRERPNMNNLPGAKIAYEGQPQRLSFADDNLKDAPVYLVHDPEDAKKYGASYAEIKKPGGVTEKVAYTAMLRTPPAMKDWPGATVVHAGPESGVACIDSDIHLLRCVDTAQGKDLYYANVVGDDGARRQVQYTDKTYRVPDMNDFPSSFEAWSGRTSRISGQCRAVILMRSDAPADKAKMKTAHVAGPDGTAQKIEYTHKMNRVPMPHELPNGKVAWVGPADSLLPDKPGKSLLQRVRNAFRPG